jgi:hypothetical protein
MPDALIVIAGVLAVMPLLSARVAVITTVAEGAVAGAV